jgi:prevent-host-death family protein
MDEIVSAAEANRNFSQILRSVREGQSYVVTSHGRPVARIVPAEGQEHLASHLKTALLARLRSQPIAPVGPWTRDELYDDR